MGVGYEHEEQAQHLATGHAHLRMLEVDAAVVLQRAVRRTLAKREAQEQSFANVLAAAEKEDEQERQELEVHAIKVQAAFRGYIARKKCENMGFAVVVQREVAAEIWAATRIQ